MSTSRFFGGNSGYIGYSESVRSAEAKLRGKFPKTTFKKEYGLSEKKFKELVSRGIVATHEWHHTSKFGNRTDFYEIDDEVLFTYLTEGKDAAYDVYKDSRRHLYERPIFKNMKNWTDGIEYKAARFAERDERLKKGDVFILFKKKFVVTRVTAKGRNKYVEVVE